ncbi:MAG: hypothetical protein L0Y66_24645, partial [Myxococcaceae bacterium]|nr:hypothetical protein [Myxococcaceae bacterium]
TALAVAWTDYRGRDWGVWAALAQDGGAFASAQQVSPPSDTEVLAADPVLAAAGNGTVLLAWEDLRARRGHRDVRMARWSAASVQSSAGWETLPELLGGADAGEALSRFRPSVAVVGGQVRAVFQDLTPGKSALYGAAFGGAGPVQPARLDDTGDSPNQLTRPRMVATPQGALVLFEDDRSGWSRLRASRWP